jgi:FAD/FMN-containing dehydrogenase
MTSTHDAPQTEPVDKGSLAALAQRFRGSLVTRHDPDYDVVRALFNAMIDKRPAVIARCDGTQDVVLAVTFAREHGLPLAVRGGGHSVSGKSSCDGGLVVDLSGMNSVEVDPDGRRARAAGGCRLGELDRATQEFELATPLGIVTDTGIAGLTLGGGIGWLNGLHGLACDSLAAAEVVTADGLVLRASADENDDLFWALRGGGGNFGVVTSFEYRLHRVGPVLGGLLLHPVEQAADVLRDYGEYARSWADELSTVAALLTGPSGDVMVGVGACWSGPLGAGARALEQLRSFGTPAADLIREMPYLEMQSLLDEGWPRGRRHYWKSSFLSELSDDVIDVLVRAALVKPSPWSVVVLQHVHGAAARVAPDATAFVHRREHWDLGLYAMWEDPADTEANVAWARAGWNALRPHLEDAVYSNNLGDEGTDRVRESYGQNYDRLAQVKSRYDPDNLFRLNQNIEPSA